MADYNKTKQYEDHLQSQSFLKEKDSESTRDSSDEESTIIAHLQWEKEYPQCEQRIFQRKTAISLLTVLSLLLIAILILLIKLASIQRSHHSDSQPHIGVNQETSHFQSNTGIRSCGTSAAEAIAAGCHFDTFFFGWTPPECTDLQLYNESLSTLRSQTGGSPAFYTPTHDAIPFSALEDYATGNSPPGAAVTDHHEIRTTWEHYLVGCAYAWQKVQRAAMRNWPLEEWSASYKLAKRCGPDLLTREKMASESMNMHLRVWFPMCGLEAEQIRAEIAAAR